MATITVSPGSSISAAIASASPGDTVLLLAGTHQANVVVNKAITLEGEEGTILEPATPGNGSGVLLSSNNITVRNLFLRNFSIGINTGSAQSNPRNNIQILNCHTQKCTIHIKINGNDWLVEGNEFERVFWWTVGSGDADYGRIFGTGHHVRRNYFHGTNFETDVGPDDDDEYAHTDVLQHFGNNGEVLRDCIIEENYITDFFQGIFWADSVLSSTITGNIIRNNVFWGTELPDQFNFNGWPSHGITLGKPGQFPPLNNVIENNLIYNCLNCLNVRGTGATATISNNIISSAEGIGTAYSDGGSTGQTIDGTGDNIFNVNSLGDDFNSAENIDTDPVFADDTDPDGPDDIIFTSDDGWLSDATNAGYGPQLNLTDELDIIAPNITIVGPNPMAIGLSEVYIEYGANAFDDVDGVITVTIDSNLPLDANGRPTTEGQFIITYTATDAADNESSEQRIVMVVDDIIPVITVIGPQHIELEQGEAFTDPGATMADNFDDNLTQFIVTTIYNENGQLIDEIDTDVLGLYTIRYNGQDSEGNAADEKIRTVDVSLSLDQLPTPVRNVLTGAFDPLRKTLKNRRTT